MFIADAHCDTLLAMHGGNCGFGSNDLQIDLRKMKSASSEGYLQFFAVFQSPSAPLDEQKKNVSEMIALFHEIADEFRLNRIERKEDIVGTGINVLLSIEGLYFLEGDVSGLQELYEKGARCISLTWNPDNEFSGGIMDKTGNGLMRKGKKLVENAVKTGMLVDVSHISDKGFWDVAGIMEETGKPFCATHSNARGICQHPRNLDDDMLRQLAKTGGFTGINMYSCFLNNDCTVDSDDVVRHIEYICALCGPDHVAFGSDFDGIERDRSALDGPQDMGGVIEKLLKLNYSESEVAKIASGNIIRVLGEVL